MIDGTFCDESCVLATEEQGTQFVNRQIKALVKRRMARRSRVVASLLGSGLNYVYTREVGVYAYMLYRKRFLKERRFSGKT